MKRRRLKPTLVRLALVAFALLLTVPEAALGPGGSMVHAQQLGEGMKRTGTVGIANETERRLFYSLICTCGCPRETLGTCTCDFAHARRGELRALLEEGKPIEEIQKLYSNRYGMHALAVPPNAGGARALWALPLVGIFLGAIGVIVVLRRWKGRGAPPPSGTAGATKANAAEGPDAYDEKLDRELEELDR